MNDNYEKYIDYYQSKLDNNEDRMNSIHRSIDDNLQKYNQSDNGDYPEHTNENFIKELTNKLEYRYIPSSFDISELSTKCEKKINLNDGTILTPEFELTNNQQFLKNFINNNTPYKGLLIFHGTGVGKTCAAVNISSSFRDSSISKDKRIIALVSKNIRGSWKDTIYDKNKGVNQCSGDSFEDIINAEDNKRITNKKVDKMIKNYYEFYGYLKFANKVKKLIESNTKNRGLTDKEIQGMEKKIIRKHFSNRILIIDEIHNLREDKNVSDDIDKRIKKDTEVLWNLDGQILQGIVLSSEGKKTDRVYNIRSNHDDQVYKVTVDNIFKNEDKNTREIIEKVIHYSEGLRLIIMSATPMFNKSTEIIWLLNLLLKNDNRPTINYDEVFLKNKKEDILKIPEGINIIKNKSLGYVSYLRGENPISFPLRLYPDNNDEGLCMSSNGPLNYPNRSLYNEGKRLISSSLHKFKFMKMYNTTMDNYQLSTYRNFIKDLELNRKKGEIRLSDRNIGLQISNVVYSNDKEDRFTNCFGWTGYDRFIRENIERRQKKCTYRNLSNPLFDIENLKNISSKIHTIIHDLMKSKSDGIIFIYSEYIYSGILPFALALEHLGFEKYGGQNILNYPEWKDNEDGNKTKREPIDHMWNPMSEKKGKRAKYIILTGDTSLSPNNNEERKQSMENNTDGEKIKIILGNAVTSEGMDFKNIREIHVLDPWYHLNKIEQIIGRGIRLCSHTNLIKEKRNVTVYLHTASIEPKIESIDTNTYRIAEEKASRIGEIEKILKENAIDSILNKSMNQIKNMKDITLKTSRSKIITVPANDKKHSKICSFLDCNLVIESFKEGEIDTSTYTVDSIKDQIKLISKIISELYKENISYTLEELMERIKNLIDTNDIIIYHTIDSMVDNKTNILNNDRYGYIIRTNYYYIFQPQLEKDTFIPLYYRIGEQPLVPKNEMYIKYTNKITIDYSEQYNCTMDYNDIYEKLRKEFINSKYYLLDFLLENEIKEDLDGGTKKTQRLIKEQSEKKKILKSNICDNFIDKLSFEKKVILLKELLCEYITSDSKKIIDKYDKIIFTFFEKNKNLIMKNDEDEYSIYDPQFGNVVGFFLLNTNKYNENQDQNIMYDYSFYIYKDEVWSELDSIGKLSIKNNFKSKFPLFVDTTPIWGYSFKDKEERHLFKIVDNYYKGTDLTDNIKAPGKVMGNEGHKPITLLKNLYKYFPEDYKKYIQYCISLIKSKEKNILSIMKKKKAGSTLFSEKMKNINDDDTFNKVVIEYMRYYYLVSIEEYNKNVKVNRALRKPRSMISKEYLTELLEYTLRSSNTYFSYDTFLLKYGF